MQSINLIIITRESESDAENQMITRILSIFTIDYGFGKLLLWLQKNTTDTFKRSVKTGLFNFNTINN